MSAGIIEGVFKSSEYPCGRSDLDAIKNFLTEKLGAGSIFEEHEGKEGIRSFRAKIRFSEYELSVRASLEEGGVRLRYIPSWHPENGLVPIREFADLAEEVSWFVHWSVSDEGDVVATVDLPSPLLVNGSSLFRYGFSSVPLSLRLFMPGFLRVDSGEDPRCVLSNILGTAFDSDSSNCRDGDRWTHILAFVQEAGLVMDYLHNRIVAEKMGGKVESTTSLFDQLKDSDGELTEDMLVEYLDAIARQAKAGFVEGEGFPVFAPLVDRTFQNKEA